MFSDSKYNIQELNFVPTTKALPKKLVQNINKNKKWSKPE